MRKRAERTRKNDRFARLFSGLVIGGVLLFQGTGFITSEVNAADPVARNRDVTSFIGVTDLSDNTYNYGLYGSPLSQSVNIYNGVNAVIGKLTADSTSLNPASAVSMTVDSEKSVNIGLDQTENSSQGTLIISGPWGGTNSSNLTLSADSDIQIGDKGSLFVGYADSGKIGKGVLTVSNGASILNNGTGDYGITVYEGGTLEFGEDTGMKALTDYYSGNGIFRNFGNVNVSNGITGSDVFSVANYIDYDSDLGTGSLRVAGDAALAASALKINGGLDVVGDLSLTSAASEIEWTSDSEISIDKLVTIPAEETTGSSLKVSSKDAAVGGLWVKRAGNAGGALTVASSADLTVNGLENKFAKDGTVSENGLYDVNLGYNFKNSSKVTFGDEDGNGMIFTGASGYTDGEGKTVDPVAGFENDKGATVTAKGDLHLYGKDLNSGVEGHSALSMTNKGTMKVTGDLDIAAASAIAFTNEGDVTANSMTVGNNLTLTNAVGGTYAAENVTLDGGTLYNSGTYSFNTMNLTNGRIRGTYTGTDVTVETEKEKKETINSNVTVGGMIQLDGETEFTKTISGTTTDSTLLTISGEGGFNGSDYSLSFTNTDVVNDGNLETAALTAKSLNFNEGSSYKYSGIGKNILSGNVTFDADADLTVSAADPLYIAAGNSLTIGAEDDLATVTFDLDGVGDTPLITLLAEGGEAAAANIHSDIELSETVKNYVPGTKTITLIGTSNSDSVYDIGEIKLANGQSNNTLFINRTGRVSDDKTSYLLDMTTKGFSDFAQTVNQKNVGNYIDSALSAQNMSDDLGNFLSDVMNLDSDTDESVVRRVLNAVSGANRANAMMLAMTDPWQYSFNQLGWETHRDYTPKCSSCGSTYRGQMGYSDGAVYDDGVVYADDGYYGGGYGMYGSVFGLHDAVPNTMWAAAHTTSFNARTDDNCEKYGITNTGISFGYDVINSVGSTLGITFDYSQPYLYSSWKDAAQHVEQTNFNLGLYGRRDYWNGVSITGYVGGGLQDMISKRDVHMAGIDSNLEIADTLGTGERYYTKYNGGSLAAAVKIARDMEFYNWCILRPFAQFDMQQVWVAEGEETGNAIALKYNKSDWNRTFVRAGFETEKNTQFARFTSRFLYGALIAGDSAPEMTASFGGDYSGSNMTVYGVDLGKNYFDAGLGAVGYLDCDYRWALSGNYDFIASDKSEAHTGTVALNYSF